MSDPTKAVFLSYAREDADAARRIAEALRGFGVEVWFDQNELRGGDQWDARIRGQIKTCALFMPVISATTQAREEAYFRLEWKLADDRSHLMAPGKPFVVPVVIDDTPEAGSVVPDSFSRSQWTRLAGGEPSTAFIEQVKRLLEAPRKPVLKSDLPRPPTLPPQFKAAAEAAAAKSKPGVPGWIWGVIAAVIVAAGAGYVLLRQPVPAALPPAVVVAPATVPAAPVAPAVSDKSIAVLPFANMSEDKDNAFFADGVHEDILTNLAYIHDFRVVSRTSVEQYRGTTKPIREIARELNVAYVLEGSVRRAGGKIRVTGQLIRAATDEHVWAKAYDRDVADVFAVQSELAQAIAGALQSAIAPETRALLDRRPTENAAAFDAYLKARKLNNMAELEDEEKIVELLQQAVQLDPNFAAAWGLLGSRQAFAYFNRDQSAGRLAQAKTAIDTAVHLAPDDPDVIESVGDYYYYGFRDYARAAEQYLKLSQLRPNDAEVANSLAYIQRRQGRGLETLASFRRTIQIDPDSARPVSEFVTTLLSYRQYEEAQAVGRRFLQKHPDDLYVASSVAQAAYAATGRADALQEFARRTVAAANRPVFLYLRLGNARACGDWAEAIRLDHEQRYFDTDTDTPRWMQDILAAATLAEAGDLPAARARAAEAVIVMNAELLRQPSNSILWANLGLGHALAGEKDDALRCAAKARELLPEATDHLQGPVNSTFCASVLAWAGEKDQALAEFARLLQVPYGPNPVLDRGIYEGSWKPLRDDPRFQALVNDPKNNQPLF